MLPFRRSVLVVAALLLPAFGCSSVAVDDSDESLGELGSATESSTKLLSDAQEIAEGYIAQNGCKAAQSRAKVVEKLWKATDMDPSPAMKEKIAQNAWFSPVLALSLDAAYLTGKVSSEGPHPTGLAQAIGRQVRLFGPAGATAGEHLSTLDLFGNGEAHFWARTAPTAAGAAPGQVFAKGSYKVDERPAGTRIELDLVLSAAQQEQLGMATGKRTLEVAWGTQWLGLRKGSFSIKGEGAMLQLTSVESNGCR